MWGGTMSKLWKQLTLAITVGPALIPAFAGPQFNGHFHLSKSSYIAGEPEFLIFEVKNTGRKPVMIHTANPLSPCSGFRIEVEGVKNREPAGCYPIMSFVCASSSEMLPHGKTHTDRILLNHSYDLRKPGRFSLHVSRWLPYDPGPFKPGHILKDDKHEEFDVRLEIVIEPADGKNLEPVFQQYAQDLKSKNWQEEFAAAQVIADLAPPSMEGTILQMLDVPQLQSYGIEGLRNLRTPAAHKALANLVRTAPPGLDLNLAIRYLGEIGDSGDVQLLLDVAHASAPGMYSRELALVSAAEVGGAEAVPALVGELMDESSMNRQSAVRALYMTGSRAAVPVLIELLRTPDARLNKTAEFGLEVLTHLRTAESPESIPPEVRYLKWAHWWKMHGESATIYKYDQCGDVMPLEKPCVQAPSGACVERRAS
jgi:hypothetical protein